MTKDGRALESERRPSRVAGIHPLLFGAWPVLFLWSQNLGETSLDVVLQPLVLVLGVVLVATLVAGLVLRDLRRGALVVTPIVVGLLMYGHVAEILDPLPIRV